MFMENMIIKQWMQLGALLSGKKNEARRIWVSIWQFKEKRYSQTKLSGYSVSKNGDIHQILGYNPLLSTFYLGNA